jgi:HEAT repeat protein
VPEVEMLEHTSGTTPYDWAHSEAYHLDAYMQAAEAVGTGDFGRFREELKHPEATVRYWGAVGYSAASPLPASDAEFLREALNDESEIVRIEAASALLQHGYAGEGLPVLTEMLGHEDLTVVLYAARAIELGGEASKPAYAEMKALYDKYESTTYDPEWFVKFTTEGFLNRVEP